MDSSGFFTLLKNRKKHPFLALCLSMVATGIAAELIYATSGRFSVAGDRVLQLIPFGILLFGILEHFFPELSRKYRHLAPIALLFCCIGMLTIDGVPFSALVSAGFGVIIGLFICAALVSFLESGNTQHLGLKVGISASLFSVAVYPLSMGYRQLAKLFPKTSIITIGLVLLALLMVAILYFWSSNTESEEAPLRAEAGELTHRDLSFLLIGLTILVLLGQVMNSGTLERQGGTASIPLLYLCIVILRVPFAALLGYWVDKRLNILGMAIPVVLMALGCLVPLFLYGDSKANVTAYVLLNLGEKGCVFLICIICMTVAKRRINKGLLAGLGMLIYFSSEGYLNLHALSLSLFSFGKYVVFPLSLVIIFFTLFGLVFLAYLIGQTQNRHLATDTPLHDLASDLSREELPQDFVNRYRLTQRESEVAWLLINHKSTKEMAKEMFVSEHTVQNYLSKVYSKTDTMNRDELRAKIRSTKP